MGIAACFVAVGIVWNVASQSYLPIARTEPAPRFDLIEMPDLETCGTNGEFRCMSDQDYMHFIGVIQEVRHLIDNPRRPVCRQSHCLCAGE
jgi:hypothetical protein